MTPRLPAFLVAIALASACAPTTTSSKSGCEKNSECRLGEVCRDHACIAGCVSDRDCPMQLGCNPESSQCEFRSPDGGFIRDAGPTPRMDAGPRRDASVPPLDAGRPDSAVVTTDGGGGLLVVEAPCDPANDQCGTGLRCLNFAPPIGAICLPSCTAPGDGGVAQSTCEFDRQCWALSDGTGACIRTAQRDQTCITYDMTTFEPIVDDLAFCAPGLLRLVDDPAMPQQCSCKLDCTLANCPGPACECTAPEECVSGLVTGGTGLCGTRVPVGGECADPFAYPFEGSDYCEPAAGIPESVSPFPYCYFDPETFAGECYLICEAPGAGVRPCPAGLLCQEQLNGFWPEGYRVCLPLQMPDAGMPMGSSSSALPPSSSGGSSSTANSASSYASSSAAGVSSSEMVGSSSAAMVVSSSAAAPLSSSVMAVSSSAETASSAQIPSSSGP